MTKDNEELKKKMLEEEIYYEIEVVDWIVRSDILGDGQLMKTFQNVAKGYDRCGDNDQVIFDYTISKLNKNSEEEVIESGKDEKFSMIDWNTGKDQKFSSELTDDLGFPVKERINPSIDLINDGKFTHAMKKILKSMKLGEQSYTILQNSWLQKHDQEAIEKYQLGDDNRLKLSLHFKNMMHIEDYFHDGTCYRKMLKKGNGTASPLSDSWVQVKIRITYNKLSKDEEEEELVHTKEPLVYTLDEYTFPPLLRSIMKTLKLHELIEVHTILKDECIPEFEDDAHGLFKKEWFDKVGEIDEKTGNQRWIVFYLEMIDFDTPENMHALEIAEKMPRLLRIKNLATKFFQKKDWKNACKQFQRMYSHYNLKDIYNNIQHEDEESEQYKSAKKELEKLELQSLTNILVAKSKLKDWKDLVEFSEKALKMDPTNIKALFFSGKAYGYLQEYEKAIEILTKVVELDSSNTDAVKEIAKIKKEKKNYYEKQKEMFKYV